MCQCGIRNRLYISGEFDRRMLEDRKALLEAKIAGLVRERAALISRLAAETLSDEQIESLKMIAERTAESLGAMEDDFAAQRRLIEQLDAHVTLTARGDMGEIHISYLIVENRVDVSHSTAETHSPFIAALTVFFKPAHPMNRRDTG